MERKCNLGGCQPDPADGVRLSAIEVHPRCMQRGLRVADKLAYADALHDLLATVDRGNMTDAVTEALREAILSGVLPAPAWLREDELAAALRVSRTPIR